MDNYLALHSLLMDIYNGNNFLDRFQLRLLENGNLVLNTRDLGTDFAYDAYYKSNTDDVNVTNRGNRVIFNETGYIFVLTRSNQTVVLGPTTVLRSGDYYYRATLDFDGVFTLYYHPKTENGNPKTWTVLWSEPDNICVGITASEGRGACGFNSICTIDDYKRPNCSCPEGYSLLDSNDKNGDCKPNFTLSCEEDDHKSSNGDLYDLSVLIDTDWPLSDYEQLNPSSEEMCRNSCLQDCFCAVAILRGDSCWKKKLPLSNGRKDSVVNGKAFMKFRKGGLPPSTTDPRFPLWDIKKNDRTLILVGFVLLGSSLFVNVALLGVFCLGFFLIYQKKILNSRHGFGAVETNLRCFSYEELAEATDGFKEELGRGAFGIVYGGAVQMGNSRTSVAVKKLDRVVQEKEREKEFRTEVHVIGQTHHKNLVRLVGFCDQGEHRILVFEFMSNGTLASFLFGETKPSWNQRSEIALGIARGLLYLHEECSTQIIHCDIKPQNILLDDYYSAIADFGLAKLLMINQSQTNTGIRGTRGYVAPEWFRNKPVTAKVDVYSFGVLLLEIIACRKNVDGSEMGGDERAILTDWVCDCFLNYELHALVEDDSEALNDWRKLQRFLMVGIWCIQEDPSERPTMRKVTQMLERVVEVPVFWVDERMVPLTDKDSNYKLAYDGFLSKVPIPPTNIHAVNVTLPAAAAAEGYQTLIKTLVDNKTIDSSSSSGSPRFDLMLLSMGPDGHVASLFPGHPLLKEKQRWVAAVEDAPFTPRERVTFTFPVINSAANFGFVITASDLPAVVKAMLAEKVGKAVNGRGCGEGEGLLLPVEMVKPRGEMRWFLDKSTAAKIEG
ncbi:hypothetical protein RHSIM_Rhsim01G0188800 [Rhododendron simsii]|uniref:non-specific serine/threonine protein kinase n=1 Tax=Rhododendron simsii TaxID=118357 RepID=A0A834LWP3_RHOSS|nr:hypothetical protein RHSIM_Rhsim01G0188800 [Rhododendron simsii]